MENVSIIIVNRKRRKIRKRHNAFLEAKQTRADSRLSGLSTALKQVLITKQSSMPELNVFTRSTPPRNRSRHRKYTKQNKYEDPFHSKFIVSALSEHRFDKRLNALHYPRQTKLIIYRCQIATEQDNCCCTCNSDAMFEVMKSLYECYKKRNCENCNCILCGHLQKEEKLSLKSFSEKEKLLRAKALKGLVLPKGVTESEKELINKVRTDLGVPIEPETETIRDKHEEAAQAGKLLPLEGKTPAEKENILKELHAMGIPLPVGRTTSEKALIAKISGKTASIAVSTTLKPSEQMRRAKAEGLLTTLKGKTPEQREKNLRALANRGIPLPEGQTPSEKQLIDKVRTDLGLPIEPKNKAIRDKHDQAAQAGLLYPLEGKTPAQKEKLLRGQHNMSIPLPKGRTPSEKSLIAKIAASPREPSKAAAMVLAPSERMRKAKAEGLLTPLTGKTPEQREKILRALAMKGLPLPEGQTSSEKKLIDKVRADLGLPIEPKTKNIRDKHEKAAHVGLLFPLEGKTPAQKEKLLQGQHNMGIPLPVGRTPSEKSLIAKIAASPREPSKTAATVLAPSERMRKAKAEGLLTPLAGKTPEQRDKILRALAMKGLPLPEGQTLSEKKLIDKVRADLGLPIEPKNQVVRDKHEQAAKDGLLFPLEGKTPEQKEKLLRGQNKMSIPLPVGRTPSEKSLIAKIAAMPRTPSTVVSPSEHMRRAKAEGLLTPLQDKTPEQREKILKRLAMKGIPLPEGTSPSEKKIIDKVRAVLGLPIEPKNTAIRVKHEKAAQVGLLFPLEGKTPAHKEKLLRGQHNLGIPLPIGRTSSEKSLIAKIAASPRLPSKVASKVLAVSERIRKAKAEGLLTPLTGQTPEQSEKKLRALAMKGLPLPEGKTPSQKIIINKVRIDLGLPIEPKNKAVRDKHEQAAQAGFLYPLEGKTPPQKEMLLRGQHNMGIPLPIGRTPSEKSLIAKIAASPRTPSTVVSLSEHMRRAKAEGLLTPLQDKTPEQREKILKRLAMKGLPLPEGQTPSEKKLIDKVRAVLGLPIEPKNTAIRVKHEKAAQVGLLFPLEGKTPAQKEKLLQGQHDMDIPLPVGRTLSEKSLIAKIAASPREPSKAATTVLVPSERMRRAKAEGLLTPLAGKTPERRDKILRALAMKGLPLPEGQTQSEKKLIDKVRTILGLPIEPKNQVVRDKHEKAAQVGLLFPLEGKTPEQKEKLLRGQHNMGIPLPIGRTPSEKALIAKIAASPRTPLKVVSLSEQLRKAKAEGLLTPLEGKTPEQKDKILKGLAMKGIPLPEGTSPSEKKLIDNVRADLGLPIEPENNTLREKHKQAAKAGLLKPLKGKTHEEKKKILKGLYDMGIPLPVGRTPSEKALIAKIAAKPRSILKIASDTPRLSEQLRKAKAEGLLTPLKNKTAEQKDKILKGLAMKGIPLPEGTSPSEKKLIDKVRGDLGLPIEPKNKALRDKHDKAAKAGLLQPLKGKTPEEKKKILKGLHDMGIPLPVGRTPSEKSLIAKIAASPRSTAKTASDTPRFSEQLRRAKAEGLLTPLKGKAPEQRDKILRTLANRGIPLPEGETPSEKKLINKVRDELGLPIEPKNKVVREKLENAAKAGLLLPLEGKTPAQKEKILRGQHNMGIPLPVGRTPSEKALIAKIAASPRSPLRAATEILRPSEQIRRAKAEGLLTPLKGKTPEQRDKILRALAKRGIPIPEGKSISEKKLIDKVRADLGLPIEPKDKDIRNKHEKAALAGLLLPLEGKSAVQKEKILRGQHNMGIPLPVGRTPSEKALIAKIVASPRSTAKTASDTPRFSEQLRRAQSEGLVIPLKDKTPEERDKILRGLATKGLPLPEGQTPSEKKLIDKVRADLGLPIEPINKAIRDKHAKAAKAGLLYPLEGKTPAQKEMLLRGQHNMGIPLPIGRTPSEKSLIAKIAAGPEEKFVDEYEDIVKTTKCDRGCGCDRKKIRFKHSYVKIKVTSPDISSFCDCPDECLPGVKSGAFIDSDGIKVTVVRATGIASFTREHNNYVTPKHILSKSQHSYTRAKYNSLKNSINFNSSTYIINCSNSDESCSTRPYSTESENGYSQLQSSTPPYEGRIDTSDRSEESLIRLNSLDRIYNGLTLKTKSFASSLDSILVLKSEISLFSTSTSESMGTDSLLSAIDDSITSYSTQYLSYQSSCDTLSSNSLDEPTSGDLIDDVATIEERRITRHTEEAIPMRDYTILRTSQKNFDFEDISMKIKRKKINRNSESKELVVLFNHLPSKLDVSKIVERIVAKNRFLAASSMYFIVPSSEDDGEQGS